MAVRFLSAVWLLSTLVGVSAVTKMANWTSLGEDEPARVQNYDNQI